MTLTSPRIRLARDLLSVLVPLVDHEVGRVPLDYGFDLQLFVPWDDCKAGRLGANRLVLGRCHRCRLHAVGAPALAGEVDRLTMGLDFDELRGDLGHALVDLPEKRFVPGETRLSRSHEGIVPPIPGARQGWLSAR